MSRAPATPASPPRRVARGRPAALSAYVLHAYDWSESSLILDAFTREQGRVVVAAKGAKRPYSQLRAVLLPLQPIHIVLGARRDEGGDVQILRGAEWVRSGLIGRPQALLPGFYLNELLIKLLPRHDPHPRLFDVYAHTVDALAQGEDVASVLRAFELFLLHEQGVLPELSKVTSTQQPVLAQGTYGLEAQSGLREQAPPAGVPGSVWLALQPALERDELVKAQRVCALAAQGLRVQLRQVLSHHLGHRPLHTRQLLMEFQTA